MTEANPTPTATVSVRGQAAHGLLAATQAALSSRPSDGPAWLNVRRDEATSRFAASGFPAPSDEAFRFTALSRVLRVPYAPRPGDTGGVAPSAFDSLAVRRVRIENGRVQDAGLGAKGGVDIRKMSDVLANEPRRLEPYLGRLAASEQGFVAQNTALFQDGIVVIGRTGAKGELIHLAYSGSGALPTLATPRALIVAEPESELSILESHTGEGDYLENSVTEVFVGAGAAIEHVRVELGSERAASFSTIAVRQERDSRYRSRVFSFDGVITRIELLVGLEEPGAQCSLDGLFLSSTGALTDHHTVVVHASPRCTSRQRYKGIADSDGIAIFDGTVIVRRGASGTEAHQENRNLLLSDDAVIHTKPHLEIDTDDVRCSHGATVGRLDPAQLFYLRSRGIDAAVARSLLTYAFAREVAGTVSSPEVRSILEEIVAARLPSGAAARELA